MISPRTIPMLSCMLAIASSMTLPAWAQSRGELLYGAHCIACHSAQVHWRDQKLARDWSSLQAQVTRWQASAMLGWSEADVVEVARYLNDTFYHFPQTSGATGAATPALPTSVSAVP